MSRPAPAWLLAIPGSLFLACLTEPSIQPFPTVRAWDTPRSETLSTDEDEKRLWEEAREVVAELEKEKDVFEDDSLHSYLQTLVQTLVPRTAVDAPRFRAVVILDSTRNASALPDGTILLSLGLMAAIGNEAELAMILGHEIAHILKRHSLIESRYAELTDSFVDRMTLSRISESEADEVGLRLVVAAGYDADASIRALECFREDGSEPTVVRPAWNSHWNLRYRRSDLAAAKRRIESTGTRVDSQEFGVVTDRIRLQAAELALQDGQLMDAQELIERQIRRDPKSGRAHSLRGESMRIEHPEQYLAPEVGEEFERAVELSPDDADALRALGLFLRDTGEIEPSNQMLRRYLEARPDAVDRKIIERYLAADPQRGPDRAASEIAP